MILSRSVFVARGLISIVWLRAKGNLKDRHEAVLRNELEAEHSLQQAVPDLVMVKVLETPVVTEQVLE